MSADPPRRDGFAARPSDADAWIQRAAPPAATPAAPSPFTARLTIDVTPALRGAIKVVAFRRGQTVAEMLRALLQDTYGQTPGDRP